MPELVPVDHDPFAPYQLAPVDHDPFVPQRMVVPNAPVIGNRPDVQQAVKDASWGAVEPFGKLGKFMTGQSEHWPTDLAGAAIGLAPIGPPGAGKLLKPAAEAVEGAVARGAAKGAKAIANDTGGLNDFIKAYHGSPHDFDRFDLSKIGTGEGAQAYGHGLYFAESPEVAEGYKRSLANLNPAQVRSHEEAIAALRNGKQPTAYAQKDIDAAREDFRYNEKRDPSNAEMADYLEQGLKTGRGRTYQVAIKAPSEHFLDWDKPFAEQPPKVQEAIKKLWTDKGGTLEGRENPPFTASKSGDTGESIHAAIATTYSDGKGRNADAQAAATAALREAGIPGIKYLDQGSRVSDFEMANVKADLHEARIKALQNPNSIDAKSILKFYEDKLAKLQKQTRNYVVFDDKLIDILKKYGVAGLAALPAAGAHHFQTNQVDHDPFAP